MNRAFCFQKIDSDKKQDDVKPKSKTIKGIQNRLSEEYGEELDVVNFQRDDGVINGVMYATNKEYRNLYDLNVISDGIRKLSTKEDLKEEAKTF